MVVSGEAIIQRIDDLAKKSGKKREQAAKFASISKSTITGWKSALPRVDHVARIAEFYSVSLDYLVLGATPKGIPSEILKLAEQIALLEEPDRYEIAALLEIKIARYSKYEQETAQNA